MVGHQQQWVELALVTTRVRHPTVTWPHHSASVNRIERPERSYEAPTDCFDFGSPIHLGVLRM